MYSLVTPSVLVVDAACRPEGHRLVALLEEVLLLDPAAHPHLCDAVLAVQGLAVHGTALFDARRDALQAEQVAPTWSTLATRLQTDLVAALGGTGTAVREGGEQPEGVAAQLARLPLGGGLAALRRFAVDEALPAQDADVPTLDEQGAQEAAADALTAVWAQAVLAPDQAQLLAAAWDHARDTAPQWQVPRGPVLGPRAGEVTTLCAVAAGSDPGVLERLADLHAPGSGWSARMHEAAWAAHLSGRLRSVAVAQLLAARSVLEAAGPAPDPVPLRRALTPVLGAVTAASLQDLLPDDVTRGLAAVWSAIVPA